MSDCAHAIFVHAQSCLVLPCAHTCTKSPEILFGNRKYDGRLFSKFGKYLLMGCGEIGISLTVHVYISNFSLYFQIYSKFKVPSTLTVENYDNPVGIFENLISKCPSFSGIMTYFLANIVNSSQSYSLLVNITDY